MTTKKILLIVFLICPVLYLSTCSYISENRSIALSIIKIGDTGANVINKFGTRPVREMQGTLSPYAGSTCTEPCFERLWFENRLSLVGEAWYVELGKDGRVMDKGRVVSP